MADTDLDPIDLNDERDKLLWGGGDDERVNLPQIPKEEIKIKMRGLHDDERKSFSSTSKETSFIDDKSQRKILTDPSYVNKPEGSIPKEYHKTRERTLQGAEEEQEQVVAEIQNEYPYANLSEIIVGKDRWWF